MIRTFIAIMRTKMAIGQNSGTTTITNSVDAEVPPIFSNLTIIGSSWLSDKVKSSNPPPTIALSEVLWTLYHYVIWQNRMWCPNTWLVEGKISNKIKRLEKIL